MEGADVEQLMRKHSEYQLQMDRQLGRSKGVKEEGRRLIQDGSTMSTEVSSGTSRSSNSSSELSDVQISRFYHQLLLVCSGGQAHQ